MTVFKSLHQCDISRIYFCIYFYIMNTICTVYIILHAVGTLTLAKPFEEDKSFSDDNKINCMDSNEGFNYDKSGLNSFSDMYKPHSKFEGSDRYFNKPFEYEKKRYTSDDLNDSEGNIQKRQVGVIYKDDHPIGILQPYQRSYRFIPVKDENDFYSVSSAQDISSNLPGMSDIDKREVAINGPPFDESYPSILTNFKIFNKLDKKRNYDAINDDNVQELKATIRRLRSSNSRNSEQIEEELKNILDDMGLIEADESHGEKREVREELEDDNDDDENLETERSKREQNCVHTENANDNNKVFSQNNFLSNNEKQNDIKNDAFGHTEFKRENEDELSGSETRRKKRQKEEINKDNSNLVENLKDSGELMISGNKSPLASSSEISETGNEEKEDKRSYDESDDYESRIERRIQDKINSLKEEVKREIEAVKKSQSSDDDTQRKKRQASDTLINEESDEVNPALHPDAELKPLVRKRRQTEFSETKPIRLTREVTAPFTKKTRRRKRNDRSSDLHQKAKNYKTRNEENDEGGDILGGDDFEEGSILKREASNNIGQENDFSTEKFLYNDLLYDRNKRSGTPLNNLDFYNNYLNNNYFHDNTGRLRRQNSRGDFFGNKFTQGRYNQFRRNEWKSRIRRRINDNVILANRPRQLSDMSDLDLFGALPKSYDGELSRYKRVK